MNVSDVLAKPLSEELLTSHIPARFAYTGVDGDPRVIPIGFLWTGSDLKIYTLPKSAKVKALEQHPRVAITIDTETFPPHVLMIREQMPGWDAEVRKLYQQMVIITVTPDWAKLLDFETTLPKAVEDLVKAYGDPR